MCQGVNLFPSPSQQDWQHVSRGGPSNPSWSWSLSCRGVIFSLAVEKEDKRGDLRVNERKNIRTRASISFLLPASRTGNVSPKAGHQIGLDLSRGGVNALRCFDGGPKSDFTGSSLHLRSGDGCSLSRVCGTCIVDCKGSVHFSRVDATVVNKVFAGWRPAMAKQCFLQQSLAKCQESKISQNKFNLVTKAVWQSFRALANTV